MYPLNLNLQGHPVLVVGGGRVAERKVQGLLEAGADEVRVVSPELTPALQELAQAGRVRWQARPFCAEDTADALLVFAATDDPEAQQAVVQAARNAGALINVADAPEVCDFQVPAVLRQGEILLSIATSGVSPALAAALKRQLAREIGPEYAVLTRILAALRPLVVALPLSGAEKKMLFQKLLESDIVPWLRDGRKGRAAAHVAAVFAPFFPVGPVLDQLPDAPWIDAP